MKPRSVLFTLLSLLALSANASTLYVDASRLDDTGVATNWATAKKTIQAAVDIAASNDTVLVTNGTYNVGKSTTPGYSVNNRLVIAKPITVRSVNGPNVTFIRGSGSSAYGTVSAIRCVYMSAGELDGFTLESGATYSTSQSSSLYDTTGGGLNMNNAVAG